MTTRTHVACGRPGFDPQHLVVLQAPLWQPLSQTQLLSISRCNASGPSPAPKENMVWRALKNSRKGIPHDPAILLLGSCPKKTERLSEKDICSPGSWQSYFQQGIGKEPKNSLTDDLERRHGAHMQRNAILLFQKRAIRTSVTTCMEMETGMQSEIHQREEGKHYEIAPK